ncbi:MAG: glutamate-cysteine ligase family protein [Tractidigestivibacter sp.]|uniref:glutamate-cysteine ligase family protein n=1 Tax=Tractidigestivibacter sp. TaxID=2847320 RepID=UPI003D928F57
MPETTKDAIYAENKRRVISYWERGFHQGPEYGLLGLEVEHQVLSDDGRPATYEPRDGVAGVREVLEELRPSFEGETLGADGDLIGLSSSSADISLEPAGQIEVSVAPHHNVSVVMEGYDEFRAAFDPVLARHGLHLEAVGYNPAAKALDLPLIPKRRYHYMDAYFHSIGTHAERMMRTTASTQVSIDYRNEKDAIRKLRVAVAMTPILTAMMDNTRTFEGEPNHLPLRRLSVWADVDDARCGIQPGLFEDGYGFSQMADWVLATPPIFVTAPTLKATGGAPAREVYGSSPMSEADVEHLLSMFWPHARLKRVVEVRPADSVPRDVIAGYVALLKGVFYSDDALQEIEEALGVHDGSWPVGQEDVEAAIREVQAHGKQSEPYGIPLYEWELTLLDCARDSLSDEECAYLGPLESFAADKPWWQAE